ncbi:MAG: DUF4367 domain-containing protein [Oscillospiraceae bacterium]|nr:DUF4367 domain-containing protein [Oscillospiraceae bacterium]
MITDDMIRTAAARSCERYTDRCIDGCDDAIHHTFSSRFESKLKKLKKKANHPVFSYAMLRVASFLLVILLGTSAWLAVDVEARAAVFGWIKEVYEDLFVYRYDDKTENPIPESDYRPSWIPDGYTEYFVNDSTELIVVAYTNEAGEMLKFKYVQNPNEISWGIDLTQMEITSAKVNGNAADLLISTSPDIASCILWSTPDNTAFYISAFLDEDDLVRIAESVEKIEN